MKLIIIVSIILPIFVVTMTYSQEPCLPEQLIQPAKMCSDWVIKTCRTWLINIGVATSLTFLAPPLAPNTHPQSNSLFITPSAVIEHLSSLELSRVYCPQDPLKMFQDYEDRLVREALSRVDVEEGPFQRLYCTTRVQGIFSNTIFLGINKIFMEPSITEGEDIPLETLEFLDTLWNQTFTCEMKSLNDWLKLTAGHYQRPAEFQRRIPELEEKDETVKYLLYSRVNKLTAAKLQRMSPRLRKEVADFATKMHQYKAKIPSSQPIKAKRRG